jgi:23S rRNA pseudouridine2605 synthase
MDSKIRLNKAMSILGISSRRVADELIKKKLIKVNDEIITELGTQVSTSDIISYEERIYILRNNKPKIKVWKYYKKIGLITTHNDPQKRKTVFDEVGEVLHEKIISVGRLDINSEGLLLLTNNNDFARFAESPNSGLKRVYKVRSFGRLTKKAIEEIKKGISVQGMHYAPIEILELKSGNKNMWYKCILNEGKNREIRKIFEHFGIMVNKLIRIQYGPYELLNMKPGEIEKTDASIIKDITIL